MIILLLAFQAHKIIARAMLGIFAMFSSIARLAVVAVPSNCGR
jgi:hypothetical protein